jgi:trans-aconitate methyltransferase
MTSNDETLAAAAHAQCQMPAFRHAVWEHHPDRGVDPQAAPPSMRIHPSDQMLRHSLRAWGEVNRSLSQYFNVALQQHSAARQIMHGLFGERLDDITVLDFACGWGRLLRFLVRTVPPANVWASEIQHDAVDFVVREFGVQGICSDADPERFQPAREFDFIWVASLFSHLPEDLFGAWLARLTSLLSPRGVLAFSVHDERLLPASTAMPESGICFLTASEIEELDSRIYGTSFVSQAFVARMLAYSNGGHARTYRRLPRGLANEQDIYVVPRDPARDLRALDGIRRGAWGCVDVVCTVGGDLEMLGWAASLDDGPLDEVIVRVGEREYRCPITVARPDVSAVVGDPRLTLSGWELRAPLDAVQTFVVASAISRRGEKALLYAGPVRAG